MTENPAVETAAPSVRAGRGSFLLKVALVAIGVAIAATLLATVAFNAGRRSRSQPIEVDIYTGAELLSESKTDQSDQRLYSINAPIADVYRFYAERLGELLSRSTNTLGEDTNKGCRKIYNDEPPVETPGRYYVRCFIDNSEGDISHRVLITITYNPNDQLTRLSVEREWGQ